MKDYFDLVTVNKTESIKRSRLRKYPLSARLGCFTAIIGILATIAFYSYFLLSKTPSIIQFSIAIFIFGFLVVVISLYVEEFKKRR